jgi:hypothetical protein
MTTFTHSRFFVGLPKSGNQPTPLRRLPYLWVEEFNRLNNTCHLGFIII